MSLSDSLTSALAAALGPVDGARARAQAPASWESLRPGALLLTTLVDGDDARTVRATFDDGWRVTLDPLTKLAQERASLELAGELLRRLAHDLQAPLTAAAGSLELAAPGPDPELAGVASLLHHVGEMQSIRAERAPRPLDGDAFELEGAWRIAEGMRREFQRHGARFDLDAPYDLDAPVSDSALRCALVVLGENALAAVKRGGTLARAAIRAEGSFVTLTVTDDGAGWPVQGRARLARLDHEPRGRRRPLGLWTLRVVTALHAGAVALTPNVDAGIEARVALRARALLPASRG
ncbi:MAG: hypothetical protein R3A48_05275 [Polyangiales bacterium]